MRTRQLLDGKRKIKKTGGCSMRSIAQRFIQAMTISGIKLYQIVWSNKFYTQKTAACRCGRSERCSTMAMRQIKNLPSSASLLDPVWIATHLIGLCPRDEDGDLQGD